VIGHTEDKDTPSVECERLRDLGGDNTSNISDAEGIDEADARWRDHDKTTLKRKETLIFAGIQKMSERTNQKSELKSIRKTEETNTT